uniref:hypothetical chloroplast RF62 n=1 Tax=Hormidiella parvula TaxID=2058785 RepID=UPI00286B6BFD|nr:hypothetical chloroplast RF62 [Hormidiella parvula]WKT05976.1 hypothetical chloroplast RF62 [Hormidiella parvula]
MHLARFALRINHDLVQRRLLRPYERVLVAVSGGQDSSCLLSVLTALQPQWHWQAAVVHCDHGWSAPSRLSASHVSQWVSTLRLDYYQPFSTCVLEGEAKSRQWRYRVLEKVAIKRGCTAILVAHTAGDRAETLLYNLLRGSGHQGLQSLSWTRHLSTQLRLVRPLLGTMRRDTSQACSSNQLPTWPDASNQVVGFHRNRIRKRLMPYVRHYFNPKIDQSLNRLAELLQGEEAYMGAVCLAVLQCTAHKPWLGQHHHPFNCLVASLPFAIQRRVLRLLCMEKGTSTSFALIESLRVRVNACSRAKRSCRVSGTQPYSLQEAGS